MAITATNIVQRALTILDEQLVTFTIVESTEATLEDIAREMLPDVCRKLVKELPFELKYWLSFSSTASSLIPISLPSNTYVKKKVVFSLPTNFWELISIKLTVWDKPVTDYILVDSPEYSKQNNPFTRNGKQNPVVAISDRALKNTKASLTLECYSVHNNDAETVDIFRYFPYDYIPDDSLITWPNQLLEITSKALAGELINIKNNPARGGELANDVMSTIKQHE